MDLNVARECMPRRDLIYDKAGRGPLRHRERLYQECQGVRSGRGPLLAGPDVGSRRRPPFHHAPPPILASEDIGLADPQALVQAAAASQALNWVGLPEGPYHLAQATLYLALAPKSNSTAAYFRAQAALEDKGATKVPAPLQDAHRDKKGLGHGRGISSPTISPATGWTRRICRKIWPGPASMNRGRKGRSRSWRPGGGPLPTGGKNPVPQGASRERTNNPGRRAGPGILSPWRLQAG